MSGLTCAAILARLGKRVLVLEAHKDTAGGGTHMFTLGKYSFDSGLHYTVPWSVPLLALTTGKPVDQCTQFDFMGDDTSTVDKIYCCDASTGVPLDGLGPWNMIRKEKHRQSLYDLFPAEKKALDVYFHDSYLSTVYVQLFLFARLLPKYLQRQYWSICRWLRLDERCCVNVTAKEFLPSITSCKPLISLLSSMWIDTGARPDRASFMMTAAVFRGISLEGGAYPRGGSSALAEELIETIESHGGRVRIRCTVQELLVEGERDAVGVRVAVTGGQGGKSNDIKAPVIISSAGYVNTFSKLVPGTVTDRLGIPRAVDKVQQSAGFVMVNIGLDASAFALGISNTNTWHIPCDSEGDHFPCLNKYFADPLSCSALETPAFITFPSVKDTQLGQAAPTTSCQFLFMAEYAWFESLKDRQAPEYAEVKKQWADKAVALLLRYFPLAEGHVDLVDVSTPLSIEEWLGAHRGAAVGIDVTPERFCDPEVRELLDVVTPVKGLYMTGQDVGFLGVTLCQLTGVLTAFRVAGFAASVKIVTASVLRGWGLPV